MQNLELFVLQKVEGPVLRKYPRVRFFFHFFMWFLLQQVEIPVLKYPRVCFSHFVFYGFLVRSAALSCRERVRE